MLNEEAGNPPFSAGQRALRELKNRPEPGGEAAGRQLGRRFQKFSRGKVPRRSCEKETGVIR